MSFPRRRESIQMDPRLRENDRLNVMAVDKRLTLLVKTARQVNPTIKLLISLGFGQNDWTYINNDYVMHENQFIPSVIQFIRDFKLDGFDIDDQYINGSSGSIPQENFDAIIKNLKLALEQAGVSDNKNYYLTITPAYGALDVNKNNMQYFDLINTQNYTGSYPTDFIRIGYPANQITQGLHIYYECDSSIPFAKDMAGIFSWTMTKDISCQYYYTHKIAETVGYPTLSKKKDG